MHYSVRISQEWQFWVRLTLINSEKPEQDFLLGTKSKRTGTEGILQGSTAQTARLQEIRHSWVWECSRAEQSFGGGVRHCQIRRARKNGGCLHSSAHCLQKSSRSRPGRKQWHAPVWDVQGYRQPDSRDSTGKHPPPPEECSGKSKAVSSGMVPPVLLFQTPH